MTRGYSNYKEGTNSRGLPSGVFEAPDPKHIATSMPSDVNFQNICKKASERIQEMKESGDRRAQGMPDEVACTSRQYRRYRNQHGLAYEFGRG